MDQFIVQNPEYFFTRSPEHCRVNPDNLIILLHHIKSAAFELPFEQGERFGKENLMELLTYLEDKCVLHRVGQRWHWAADSYPADEVSLRSINPENVVVVDTTDTANHKVIAEVDWDSTFTTVHDDALYMVESQQYQVDKLDLERKKAYVRNVDVYYYTDAMTYTNVRVMDDFGKKMKGCIIVEHGEVQVSRKVVGYKKIKFYTSENVGYGDVNLPQKYMHTTSYWFTIPWDLLDRLELSREEIYRRPFRACLLPAPNLCHAGDVGHPRHRQVHRRQERRVVCPHRNGPSCHYRKPGPAHERHGKCL